jgi:hypothetical protein
MRGRVGDTSAFLESFHVRFSVPFRYSQTALLAMYLSSSPSLGRLTSPQSQNRGRSVQGRPFSGDSVPLGPQLLLLAILLVFPFHLPVSHPVDERRDCLLLDAVLG